MPPLGNSGTQIGQATGRIRIDTSRLQSDRHVVITAAQQMGAAFKQSFQASENAVKSFGQRLQSEAARIQKMRGEILAVSAAAAGFSVLGLRAADNIQLVNIRLRAITGSQQQALALMAQLEAAAKRFALPVTETQAALSGLIAVLPDGTRNLDRWVGLVARLATLNRGEGVGGAVFAIREAISSGGTDLVSLSERFNIPRKRLRDLIEETGSFDAALDQVLNTMGATTEAAEEMGRTLTGSVNRATDSLGRAAATALGPFIAGLADIADRAATFFESLRENNPAVLQFAGGLSLIVAAGGPLLLFFGQLITSLNTIKTLAPGAYGALGSIGAVGAGIAGGVGIARLLADAGAADPRLRTDSGEAPGAVIGERLKQAIVAAADTIVSFAGIVAAGAFVVQNAFEQVGNALRLGVETIKSSFGRLEQAIGQVLVDIGLRFGNRALVESGVGLIDTGSRRQSEADPERKRLAERLSEGIGLSGIQQYALQEATDRMREVIVGGLNSLLFPAEELEQVANDAGTALGDVADQIGESAEFLDQQGKDLGDATRSYEEERTQIIERGDQERLDIEKRYADAQVKIAEDAAEAAENALDDLIQQRDALRRDVGRDDEKSQRDLQRDELDELIDLQRDEAKAARDHARRMRDIQRESDEQEEEMASDRNFAGLFKLRRDTSRRLEEENQRFLDERVERQIAYGEQISDLRRAFEAERQERYIKFQQDLNDAAIAYQLEQQQLEAQRQDALARNAAARTQDVKALAAKITQELKLRRDAFVAELQLIAQGSQQRLEIEQQYLSHALELAAQFGVQFNELLRSALTPTDTSSYAPGAGLAARAFGGPLRVGQSAIVNDAFQGQRELFRSGGARAAFPSGLGIFTPVRPGTVETGGGGNVFNQYNTITSNRPEETARLIDQRARQLIKEFFT